MTSTNTSTTMLISTLNMFFFKSIHTWDALYTDTYTFDSTIFDASKMSNADSAKLADLPRNKTEYMLRFLDPALRLDTVKNPANATVTIPTTMSNNILAILNASPPNSFDPGGPLLSIPNLTVETMYTVMPSPFTPTTKIRFLSSNLTFMFFRMVQGATTETGALNKKNADDIATTISDYMQPASGSGVNAKGNNIPEFKNLTYTLTFNRISGIDGSYISN